MSALVCCVALLDLGITKGLLLAGAGPAAAKSVAILCGLVLNFAGRKYFVFYEAASGPWAPQGREHRAGTERARRAASFGKAKKKSRGGGRLGTKLPPKEGLEEKHQKLMLQRNILTHGAVRQPTSR